MADKPIFGVSAAPVGDLAIGKAAGNRILFKTLENIKGLLRYQQATINRLPDIINNSSARHREIFGAIRDKDPDRAGRSMTGHITEVIDAWKQMTGPVRRIMTGNAKS